MKIAAIDLGSNSFHMVIVEVNASGAFQLKGQEKEMVRLGAVTLSRGLLSAAARRRGLQALVKYKRIAQMHGAEKILAVATSAVREARNGEDYLDRIGQETGIWPRVVPGEEEARLIYLAVLHSIRLEGKRALVIDIGGGSVELILGSGQAVEFAVSEKLGAIRMTERFVKSDPLSSKDEEALVAKVDKDAKVHRERIPQSGFDCAVGTSGTILALGGMARQMQTGSVPESLHHVTVGAASIHALRKRLVEADLRERLKMPGMDPRRADIIVAGAVVLDTLLERLGVSELTLCEWALREGILLDYIQGHGRSLARAEAYPDVRRRSVVELAERCQYVEPHARHVAGLALALFDGTRKRHALGNEDRTLLEYAALLHGVGHHIAYPDNHRHSYYLIKNGDLRGFDPVEVEVLANVARYHRRGRPRKKHAGFASLPKGARRKVRVLSGLLRMADALDRSHRQVIRAVDVSERADTLTIHGQAQGDCELELWAAERRKDLLEEALDLAVRVKVSPAGEKAAAVSSAGEKAAPPSAERAVPGVRRAAGANPFSGRRA